MYKVDLNSDLGESFGNYTLGKDEEILKYITSANIACGWHAGDPIVMDETITIAKENTVGIGAHPGFLDKMGFGRREMNITPKALKNYIKYQLGALTAIAQAHNQKIQHVKPHGAMYNMAAKDETLATAVAEAVAEVNSEIILLGLANSELTKAGERAGLKVAHEVFADRAYEQDGTLVSRAKEGAVIHDVDTVADRILTMIKKQKVKTLDGQWIDIKADSICVHGDTKEALAFVRDIKNKLEADGIQIVSLAELDL
jgi:UPF0271 protein